MCNGKTVIFSILLLLFSVQVIAETDADADADLESKAIWATSERT